MPSSSTRSGLKKRKVRLEIKLNSGTTTPKLTNNNHSTLNARTPQKVVATGPKATLSAAAVAVKRHPATPLPVVVPSEYVASAVRYLAKEKEREENIAASMDNKLRSSTSQLSGKRICGMAGSKYNHNTKKKKKKLIIKSFRRKPRLPVDFEQNTWKRLREAVKAIQRQETLKGSREELYHSVESLCLHQMAPNLYRKLERLCDAHITTQVEVLSQESSSSASTSIGSSGVSNVSKEKNADMVIDASTSEDGKGDLKGDGKRGGRVVGDGGGRGPGKPSL